MSDNNNISILYVDDEEINLFIFSQTFQDDYSVLTANSGAEGLEKLESSKNKINIVISDMRMPNMNGVEFITRAKAKYDDIVYFILTGYSYNEEIDFAIKDKVIQKFFTKPFNKPEIEAAINDALSQ